MPAGPRISRWGIAAIIATVLALGAAGTTIGLTLSMLSVNGSIRFGSWIDYVLVAGGGACALCAIVVLVLQALRCSAARRSRGSLPTAALLLSLAGLVAALGVLASLTVYNAQNDVFAAFSSWTTLAPELFAFGASAGALAWLLAVVFAGLDFRAWRNQVADASLPITAAPEPDEFLPSKGSCDAIQGAWACSSAVPRAPPMSSFYAQAV